MLKFLDFQILPFLLIVLPHLEKIQCATGAGLYVQSGHIPFQVILKHADDYYCGGVIYDEYTIITAAHCVKDRPVNGIRVWAGSVVPFQGEARSASGYKLAPNYVKYGRNDIALIRLSTPFRFNDKIGSVKLAPSGLYFSTGTCFLSGFGYTSANSGATNLKEVIVNIRDPSVCENEYNSFDSLTMVCAGDLGTNACIGDSGGPLICNGVLYGTVSMVDSTECKATNVPTKFMNIAKFHEWIVTTANSFGSQNDINYRSYSGNNNYRTSGHADFAGNVFNYAGSGSSFSSVGINGGQVWARSWASSG